MSTATANLLLRDRKMSVNPFSDDYWHAELKAYGLRRSKFHVEHVSVTWGKIKGRCDDYLNVNMRFDDTPIPQLAINGNLWMSLTPMEIQSSALALHRARGHVIAGGLGLGYFPLRAAAKPEVVKVTVFEQEPLVIEWFKRMFKDHPELAKIEIIEGDMRKTCKGYTADLAFVDIYPDLLAEGTFTDPKLLRKKNKIARYMFWGYERVMLELVLHKMIKHASLYMANDLLSYFTYWKETPYMADDPSVGTLSDYYRSKDAPPLDLLKAGKRVMTDYPM